MEVVGYIVNDIESECTCKYVPFTPTCIMREEPGKETHQLDFPGLCLILHDEH